MKISKRIYNEREKKTLIALSNLILQSKSEPYWYIDSNTPNVKINEIVTNTEIVKSIHVSIFGAIDVKKILILV